MSDLSNNIAVLTHLKDKVHKWKNIAILCAVIASFLLLRAILGSDGVDGAIETSGDYVANIKIEGNIVEDSYRSKILEEIAQEDSIKAVIVDIDSPGGGIVGSEILYSDLREIAAKKPIVVVMGSVAASGGYMGAIASDYIIAHNGTLTGSIGVLMQSVEVVDLAKKLGVNLRTYKSSPLKASPSPFEKSSLAADLAVDESIKDSAQFFYDLVKARRGVKLNKSEINKIFDGRVFTGRQALKAGLVDQIGGKKEALNYLQQNHKIDVESLKVHEVSVIEVNNNIIEKFLGYLPFAKASQGLGFRSGIMAILSL